MPAKCAYKEQLERQKVEEESDGGGQEQCNVLRRKWERSKCQGRSAKSGLGTSWPPATKVSQ